MQYQIIWLDWTDADAPTRRANARWDHIALWDQLVQNGNMRYGAAILDNDWNMIWSSLMMYFNTQEEFDQRYTTEPYIIWKVWEKIEVYLCNTRDPWQFNRSKEFFKSLNH